MLSGEIMLKERLYGYYSIDEANYALDLYDEKEQIYSVLNTSTPRKVKKFNSKGTAWDLCKEWNYSNYKFCINGGEIVITDVTGSIFDFLNFIEHIAYYNDKNLMNTFDDEGFVCAMTVLPVENNCIRISVFDNGFPKNKTIISDIIIGKTTFIKQIRNILLKIEKYMDNNPDNVYENEVCYVKNTIQTLGQYLDNKEEFQRTYIPTSHVRVFDIAYKDLDKIWKFDVCLEDEEKADIDYWEKLKADGKILDYDFEEQFSEELYTLDKESKKIIPISKDELRKSLETDMSNRVEEKNWVYSKYTQKWYATNEIMPEPQRQLGIIHKRLRYEIKIDIESYPQNEDEQLKYYIDNSYDINGNLIENKNHLGYLKCRLNIISDNSTVCQIEFDYRNNKEIRTALEKAKNGEYVRFDLGGYKQDKFHIWQKKYSNNKGDDYLALACYEKTGDDKQDKELYYCMVEKSFIDCFLNALDEIRHKLDVTKYLMDIGKNLKIEDKFKILTKRNSGKIEYIENFKGNYACIKKDNSNGWGIIDKNFNWIIKPEYVTVFGKEHPKYGKEIKDWIVKYKYLHNIDGSLFIASRQDEKQFVMDINGDIQILHVSDKIYYSYLNGKLYFLFCDEDKTIITDSKGKDLLTLDFMAGERFYLLDDIIILSKDEKFGIINWKGKTLIDFIFSDINPDKNNLDFIPVKYINNWGFINKKGKVIDMKIKEQEKSEADLKCSQVK